MGVRFDTFLKWAVCLTPIIFTMNKSQQVFQFSVFSMFTAGMFLISINRSPLFFILLSVLASYVVNGINPISTGAFLAFVLFYISCHFVAVYSSKDFDLLKPLAVVCSLGIVSAAFERFGWSFFNPSTEPGGLIGNAPQLCLLICLLIPFLIYRRSPLSFSLAVLCLLMGEITGLVTWIIARCIYLKSRWMKVGIIVSFIALGCVLWPHIWHSIYIRLPIWSSTLLQIAKQPLFGYGPGTFDSLSGQFITGYWHAENCFSSLLQAVFNCGVFMLAAVVLAIRKLWESNDSPERTALIVLAVLSVFEYPIEVMKFWPVYAVLVGTFLAKESYVS